MWKIRRSSQMREADLSHDRLLELLHYDPETGEFTWRQTSRRMKKGARAGHYNTWHRNRYVNVGVDGTVFQGHRLAWFYMTGEWPKHEVDHRDLDGWNNRWQNLREATGGQNRCNTNVYAKNKLGVKGVYYRPPRPEIQKTKATYEAKLDGKYIGSFDTFEEAKAARELAARASHGEFYREQ